MEIPLSKDKTDAESAKQVNKTAIGSRISSAISYSTCSIELLRSRRTMILASSSERRLLVRPFLDACGIDRLSWPRRTGPFLISHRTGTVHLPWRIVSILAISVESWLLLGDIVNILICPCLICVLLPVPTRGSLAFASVRVGSAEVDCRWSGVRHVFAAGTPLEG